MPSLILGHCAPLLVAGFRAAGSIPCVRLFCLSSDPPTILQAQQAEGTYCHSHHLTPQDLAAPPPHGRPLIKFIKFMNK